ncbi:ATP phosphoribosyltransferase [Dethiothermospora halolimnae]|uniref:ATP phosphoribosyltransferase n=1 Tax=Dethiothermospora halolimnae TaxID=3114390 RepID=UPI003CCBACED
MSYLSVALAKGRIAEDSIKLFKKINLGKTELNSTSRKLVLKDEEEKIKFIFVKPTDVPTYVERGVADIGIVGKDTIMEEGKNIYEIMDLGFGKCKISIAALKGFEIHDMVTELKIATKYPNIAKNYFYNKGIDIDIIKLNGSVELAPIMGLSDIIVDIVETGRTLKENGLEVIEDMHNISARFISNKVSFKVKNNVISKIINKIERYREGENR